LKVDFGASYLKLERMRTPESQCPWFREIAISRLDIPGRRRKAHGLGHLLDLLSEPLRDPREGAYLLSVKHFLSSILSSLQTLPPFMRHHLRLASAATVVARTRIRPLSDEDFLITLSPVKATSSHPTRENESWMITDDGLAHIMARDLDIWTRTTERLKVGKKL
jgi:hypothetical protein